MKKIFCLTWLALFCISFSVNAQEADPTPIDTAHAAQITFQSLEYDYGNIYKGDNPFCEFTFTNTGNAPLQITNARASCGCTVPSWPREEIGVGQSGVIRVKYDTNRLGMINKTITVSSNARNNTVMLRIKGNISEKPVESVPAQEAPMMQVH